MPAVQAPVPAVGRPVADPGRIVPRVLAVPPPVLRDLARRGPVEGEPDLVTTRLLLGGGVLLFALTALAVAAGLVLLPGEPNARGHEVPIVLAMLALLALACGGGWYVWRLLRRAGGIVVRVDAEGLQWGDAAAPQSVAWQALGRARSGPYDVRTEYVSSEALQKRLVLHRAGAEPAEIRLPLTLSADGSRVLRFRNRAEVLRALLLRLATEPRPRLRFDAEVFIDAGLDPQTWTPMPAPRRWMWASTLGALVPPAVLMAVWPLGQHTGWLILALLLATGLGAWAAAWFVLQRYPGLQGVFEFETPAGPVA